MTKQHSDLAETIIGLINADIELRDQLIQCGKLSGGYNSTMARLHNKNEQILNEIIDKIGYPTTEKVGKLAYEAAWMVIQHAIGQPVFMKNVRNCWKNYTMIENTKFIWHTLQIE